MGPWLSVNPDSDFHLVLAQLKSRLSRCGHRAGTDCRAHGPDIVDYFLGRRLDFLQGSAPLRQSAGDFVDKYGPRYAPPANGVKAVLNGHIVAHHHLLDLDAFHLGHLCRHLKIHHIAGVVFHNHQDSGAAVYGLDALIDGVRSG